MRPTDTVSKADVLETYAELYDIFDDYKEIKKELYKVYDKLNALPYIQPTIEERKTGEWKRAYLNHEAMGERPSIFYCSVCNQCIAYPVNYCPSCGAKMEGNT